GSTMTPGCPRCHAVVAVLAVRRATFLMADHSRPRPREKTPSAASRSADRNSPPTATARQEPSEPRRAHVGGTPIDEDNFGGKKSRRSAPRRLPSPWCCSRSGCCPARPNRPGVAPECLEHLACRYSG